MKKYIPQNAFATYGRWCTGCAGDTSSLVFAPGRVDQCLYRAGRVVHLKSYDGAKLSLVDPIGVDVRRRFH